MLNGFIATMLMSAMGAGAPANHGGRTIVRLVGQRGAISVCSSASGPRYSATDPRGAAIFTNLSLAELRKTHPDLSRQIDSANCDDISLCTPMAGLD
jgi:hypothetical protein